MDFKSASSIYPNTIFSLSSFPNIRWQWFIANYQYKMPPALKYQCSVGEKKKERERDRENQQNLPWWWM